MLKSLIHAARVVHALVREHVVKAASRSPKWPAARREYLKVHPACEVCGSTSFLQVHHKMPFHTKPSLELDPSNFICLCMSKNECHVHIGHGDSYKFYNPNVEKDAFDAKMHPDQMKQIFDRAEAARLPNAPEDSAATE